MILELTENDAQDMVVHYFTKVTPHPRFITLAFLADMTGLVIYAYNQGIVAAERGTVDKSAH